MKKKTIAILISALILVVIVRVVFIFCLIGLLILPSEFEVNTDINKYNDYIGDSAKEEYRNKWGMDESIFPHEIDNSSDVVDYKMVYYNPWDAQFLSYLVVDYNDYDYLEELQRLREYPSTKYRGYYGVKGFDKYSLLAMYADDYHGFVYAITDGESRIIYVELIFCNYQYDFDYEKYINKDYLPVGFDARENNRYESIETRKNEYGL